MTTVNVQLSEYYNNNDIRNDVTNVLAGPATWLNDEHSLRHLWGSGINCDDNALTGSRYEELMQ